MRLFVAIDIPEIISDELSKVAEELPKEGIARTARETYHITLQFLENIDPYKLSLIKNSLSSIKQPKFKIEVSGISYFKPGPRVIFANINEGVVEIQSIYDQVAIALKDNGIVYKIGNKYTPHITIARVKSYKNRREVLSLIEKYSKEEFGSFYPTSVMLKESIQTSGGHVHNILHEVQL